MNVILQRIKLAQRKLVNKQYVINNITFEATSDKDLILNKWHLSNSYYQKFLKLKKEKGNIEALTEIYNIEKLKGKALNNDVNHMNTYVINGNTFQAKDDEDLIRNIWKKTQKQYYCYIDFLKNGYDKEKLLTLLYNNEYPFRHYTPTDYNINGKNYNAYNLKDLVINKMKKTEKNFETLQYIINKQNISQEEALELLDKGEYPFDTNQGKNQFLPTYNINGEEFRAKDDKELILRVMRKTVPQYHTYKYLVDNGEDKNKLLTLLLNNEYPFDENKFIKKKHLIETFNVDGKQYEVRDLEDLIINKLHKTQNNYKTFKMFLNKGYSQEKLFKLLIQGKPPFEDDIKRTRGEREYVINDKTYTAQNIKDLIINQLHGNESHVKTMEYLNKKGTPRQELLQLIEKHEYPFETERNNSIASCKPLNTYHIDGEEWKAESAYDLLINLLHYPNEEYKQYALYRKQKRFAEYSDDEFLTAFVNREYPFNIFK